MPQLAQFLRSTSSRLHVTVINVGPTIIRTVPPRRTSISPAFSPSGKPRCDLYSSIPTILSHRFIHSSRAILSTSPTNIYIPEHLFSPNTSQDTIAEASNLLASAPRPWSLTESPPGLQRKIKFKTFATAIKFLNTLANECMAQKHHPEWGNVYNEVVVRWTTHRPKGISSKDVRMAKFCDRTAAELGEIQELAFEGKDQSDRETQTGASELATKESSLQNSFDRANGKPSQASSKIPYRSEIVCPRTPLEKGSAEKDLLTSLLGTKEQMCRPCHTGKENSTAVGTESGLGDTGIKPKATSPHFECTEGQSVLEEIKKHRDELDLAEPVLGEYQENLRVVVEMEKESRD